MAQYLNVVQPLDKKMEERLIEKADFSFKSTILDEIKPRRRSVDMCYQMKVENNIKVNVTANLKTQKQVYDELQNLKIQNKDLKK
jgi:hypothetical protein